MPKEEQEKEREWDRERASSSLSKTEGIMSWVRFSSPYLDMRQMGRGHRGNETDTIIHERNVFKQTVSRWQMRTALTSYLHSCLFAWQTPLAEVTSNPAVILKAYFEAYNQILPVNSWMLQTQRPDEKSWNNDALQNTSKEEEQTNGDDDDWIYIQTQRHSN